MVEQGEYEDITYNISLEVKMESLDPDHVCRCDMLEKCADDLTCSRSSVQPLERKCDGA